MTTEELLVKAKQAMAERMELYDTCMERARRDARQEVDEQVKGKIMTPALYEKQLAQTMEAHLTRVMRGFCKTDLFFLLRVVLKRADVEHPWLFMRCIEVQENPDGNLDLWSREHYKSTIITYAKTIQDILCNPDITIGIFSHTKSIAREFLKQIKYELENNETLKKLFPDILYDDPRAEAPARGVPWSVEKGITVKRSTNPKEQTVEGHGLVDGQPTGKHFSLLIYDDVVTLESVSTPDMIRKTTDALRLSYNLGAHGGKRRFVGTRYHFNDTYDTLIKAGTVKLRIHPCTDNGKDTGYPVFLTKESLETKRKDMGAYIFGCQMLQDPKADSASGFRAEWFKYYTTEPELDLLNIYIVVDPAHSKKAGSDFTSMWVIGLGADRNYYILDGVRDKLNLKERTDKLFEFHREYQPEGVGYERYGLQSDIEHMEEVMDNLSYRFHINELNEPTSKEDRIRRLIPRFEQGRIFFPRQMPRIDYEGKKYDLVTIFRDQEYLGFPVCATYDMLDNLANIVHPKLLATFPMASRRDRKKSWEDKLEEKLRERDLIDRVTSGMVS